MADSESGNVEIIENDGTSNNITLPLSNPTNKISGIIPSKSYELHQEIVVIRLSKALADDIAFKPLGVFLYIESRLNEAEAINPWREQESCGGDE